MTRPSNTKFIHPDSIKKVSPNLRKCLAEITNWKQKLFMLYQIINGLNSIHKKNLIHFDLHDGNILCNKNHESIYGIFISDYLGSCQLAKSFLTEDNIYGVLPFMAPEVLKGKPYTQASDIFSFSMIMWEFTSGVPPFNNRAHDIQLASSICKGERPEIIENTPQCYIDLMKKCWDDNPLKRPSASEILDIIKKWRFLPSTMIIENINEELKINIMEFINQPIGHNNLITEPHSQAYYTSHLLGFTSEELLNEVLNESKFFELKQKQKDTEQKLLKLETYFQSSYQNIQNIQMELFNLQQRNFQFEQDNQKLRLDLAIQIKEFAEKENTLQTQITCLQNKEQAKLTNEQVQIQISQLKQEKINLQEKLNQIENNIQKFKSQQESLIEQKERLENKLIQSQPLQVQEFTNKEKNEIKAKLENEIIQLKQKLINEEQIKVQLAKAMYVKDDRINKLEINLDQDHIKKTSAFCNNKIKQVLNQVNEFLKAKSDFLTLREETIKKLQKQYEVISNGIAVSETKKFQEILVKCNEVGLFQMEKDYNSLKKIVKENKELEVSPKINDILRLNYFDLNKYKIFTIVANSWEGTRTHLDSDMMTEDIKSLKKNLGELKAVLRQQKKELLNLQ
jgi:serine/threonine protein kinase